MRVSFADKLISWYDRHHRPLPWRESRDPYRIWLSEVILQQTRVAQGLPYYSRFIQRFPTLEKLAVASQQEVLSLWQGLGYYSRAHNLHACAKTVWKRYGGRFPDTYSQLLKLPGIGNYTAAAISSIAFNQPHAVVDGNVYRVLARMFGIEHDVSTQSGKKYFSRKADLLLDSARPGDYNQALMEFGALCCTSKSPLCKTCIFHAKCVANALDMQSLLPHKSRKQKTRNRYLTYFVFQQQNKVALCKRDKQDIWKGLYDFYGVESSRLTKSHRIIAQDEFLSRVSEKAVAREDSKIITHTLSHQTISARFVLLTLPSRIPQKSVFKKKKLMFYAFSTIPSLPKSALITRYLSERGWLKEKENA